MHLPSEYSVDLCTYWKCIFSKTFVTNPDTSTIRFRTRFLITACSIKAVSNHTCFFGFYLTWLLYFIVLCYQAWTAVQVFSDGYVMGGSFQIPLYSGSPPEVGSTSKPLSYFWFLLYRHNSERQDEKKWKWKDYLKIVTTSFHYESSETKENIPLAIQIKKIPRVMKYTRSWAGTRVAWFPRRTRCPTLKYHFLCSWS